MVNEWEYNSLCREVKTKQETIDRHKESIRRLEHIIAQWAMRLNEYDPVAAGLMLDALVDSRR